MKCIANLLFNPRWDTLNNVGKLIKVRRPLEDYALPWPTVGSLQTSSPSFVTSFVTLHLVNVPVPENASPKRSEETSKNQPQDYARHKFSHINLLLLSLH
jgi:hypothetical protein